MWLYPGPSTPILSYYWLFTMWKYFSYKATVSDPRYLHCRSNADGRIDTSHRHKSPWTNLCWHIFELNAAFAALYLGIVTGDRDLCQHYLRQWLVALRNQTGALPYQCWFIIDEILRYSHERNFTASVQTAVLYHKFENYDHISQVNELTHWVS